MPAYRLDLLIEQGSKFERVVAVQDATGQVRNLTGYTARMQARESISSSSTLFDITPDISGAQGLVTVTIPSSETTDYTWSKGVYDLEIVNTAGDGEVERILEGGITLSLEVTRD